MYQQSSIWSESSIWSNLQIEQWRLQILKALELQAFIDWLKQFDSNEIVGMAYRTNECPLSNYLQDKLPHLDCRVGRSQIFTEMPSCYLWIGSHNLIYLRSQDYDMTLPTWVTAFIDRIDDLCMRSTLTYRQWEKGEITGMLQDFEFPVIRRQALLVAVYLHVDLRTDNPPLKKRWWIK